MGKKLLTLLFVTLVAMQGLSQTQKSAVKGQTNKTLQTRNRVKKAPTAYEQAMGTQSKYKRSLDMKNQKEPFKALVDGMELNANGMFGVSLDDMISVIAISKMPNTTPEEIFGREGPEWWEEIDGFDVEVSTSANKSQVAEYIYEESKYVWATDNLRSIYATIKLVDQNDIKKCYRELCKKIDSIGTLRDAHDGTWAEYDVGEEFEYSVVQGSIRINITIRRKNDINTKKATTTVVKQERTAITNRDNQISPVSEKSSVNPSISTTINKSDVFFSRAEAKGSDVEIVCWLNPRINGTRMEAMNVKYELDGKLTSKQSRVSGYGGKELPRNGNVLNRGNRVNHGEKFFVTATIKNVAYLHSLNSVYIRVWTSYGEGDVIIKDVKW